MRALPEEPGAVIASHGNVVIEHHPARNEVRIYALGTRVWLTDADGRDLAYALAEVFPSMVREPREHVAEQIATAERSAQNARNNATRMASEATRSGEAVYRVQSYADRCAEMARQDPGRVVSRALVARELNDAIKGEQR